MGSSGLGLLGLDAGAEFPEEADEFAGDGDLDFIVVHFAFFQGGESVAQPDRAFKGVL